MNDINVEKCLEDSEATEISDDSDEKEETCNDIKDQSDDHRGVDEDMKYRKKSKEF